MHSLGKTIKQVVHSVTRGAYSSAQARSNVFQVPELLRVVILILRGEGAPETLMGASCYSSTLFLMDAFVYPFPSSERVLGMLQVRVVTQARLNPLGEGAPETLVEALP